jgi:hypothetical protein
MVSKCANPACDRAFRYLADGRLFHIDVRGHPELARKRPDLKRSEDIEHFWLCGDCARQFTVTYVDGQGITAVPLSQLPRVA